MYQRSVGFFEAIGRAFSNYCVFTGRASRSEYWWFVLFCFIVEVILYTLAVFLALGAIFNAGMGATSPAILMSVGAAVIPTIMLWIFGFLVFLPTLGLMFRRLHDTGHSGWWWLIGFVPFVGGIVLLVFFCLPSYPGENKYGPIPNEEPLPVPPYATQAY